MARPRKARRAPAPGGRRRPGEPSAIGLRTHAEPEGWAPRPPAKARAWPKAALIVETVARPEAGEPLWFGIWRLVALDPSWFGAAEGVFHADDLAAAEIEALAQQAMELGLAAPTSRKEFVDTILGHLVYKRELPLVSWFLPVDLGRLAVDWSESDRDGIGLTLWTWPKPARRRPGAARRRPLLANGEIENSRMPRIVVRMLDGQRPLISFNATHKPDERDQVPEDSGGQADARKHKRGRFLTLAMLASSLLGERCDTLHAEKR